MVTTAALLACANANADSSASCPDAAPDLEAARGAKPTFDPGHARLTEAGKVALQPLVEALHARPKLRLAITSHSTTDIDRHDDVTTKRRAEVVKWYLVDTGVEADRIETGVSPIVLPGRAIDIRFSIEAATGCPPPRVYSVGSIRSSAVDLMLVRALTANSDGHRLVGVDLGQLIAKSHTPPSAVGSSDVGGRASSPPHLGTEHLQTPPTVMTELQPAPVRGDESVHRVTLGPTRIGSPLPAPDDVVTRISTSYMPGLSYCYRKAQRANPGVSGRVALTFSVDENGRVLGASAHGLDDDLDSCIATQMARWHFSNPVKDPQQVFSMSLALQGP
jgi:hypothetical protein